MRHPAWLVLADAVRVAGVVSFAVAVSMGGIPAALFALVLLGLTLLRLVPLPRLLDAATGSMLVLAAWAALLDWYLRYPNLDIVVHTIAMGLVSLAAVRGLLHLGWVAAVPRAGITLLTVCVGVTLGVAWEFGEWVGHTLLDPRIQVGYDDTLGDLASDWLGAWVAALWWSRTSRTPRSDPPTTSAVEERPHSDDGGPPEGDLAVPTHAAIP